MRFNPLGDPDRETPWLEPYPDSALPEVQDEAPGPEAVYETREAIRLAFIAAIHELPPRQRAVLLLRDVVGLTADETAMSLETTRAAVNSALQRARSTMTRGYTAPSPPRAPDIDDAQRELLERYVRAWEAADVDGFVGLLAQDAVWSMPPWPEWYVGRDAIGAFMTWVWDARGGRHERLTPTAANGSPAFAYYRSTRDRTEWQPFAIQVLGLGGGGVTWITNFVDAGLFGPFGLPAAPTDPAMNPVPLAYR